MVVVRTFVKNIRNSPGALSFTSKEPVWTFDVTRNNSYVQLLAPLPVFLPLLCDLCQRFTERFLKPAVVHDLSLALHDWIVQGALAMVVFCPVQRRELG